jgi:hypothetical protein
VFRNSEGEPVDPVPYFVVTGLAFLGSYSFLPVYCLSLGTDTVVAVIVPTAVFVCLATVTYYRMVWTTRPNLQGEVPAELRLQRIVYTAVVVVGVLIGLTLILLSR